MTRNKQNLSHPLHLPSQYPIYLVWRPSHHAPFCSQQHHLLHRLAGPTDRQPRYPYGFTPSFYDSSKG